MGRCVWRDRGGIRGLVRLLKEYGEAVEYDLLSMGLHLDDIGSPALTWRDLHVIVRNLPRASALVREKHGEATEWGAIEHLLAIIADRITSGNWQRGGGRGSRPKPIDRPGSKGKAATVGADPIPIRDFNAWWESPASP